MPEEWCRSFILTTNLGHLKLYTEINSVKEARRFSGGHQKVFDSCERLVQIIKTKTMWSHFTHKKIKHSFFPSSWL